MFGLSFITDLTDVKECSPTADGAAIRFGEDERASQLPAALEDLALAQVSQIPHLALDETGLSSIIC
jgi:hypothetical protein